MTEDDKTNILRDYSNRTIKSVRDVHWGNAEKTSVVGMVLFQELEDITGEVPFASVENADTYHGREFWEKAVSGEYGPISDYVEPEPQPEPIPDEISRRQFFQYLAVLGIISRQEALAALQSGAIPEPLQAIIDQLPTEDDQFEAQMFIIGAQNFNRLHPLSDTVRLALEWTVEQKDDFWRQAFKL